MNLIAKFKRKTFNKEGKLDLILEIEPSYLSSIDNLDQKEYDVSIKGITKKRSLRQNSKLWALINEIAIAEDGNAKNSEDIYLNLLEMSGGKSTVITMKKEAYEDFKREWRHVKVLDEFLYKGTPYVQIQAYYGSSTFDTKEMTQLIDTTLHYASEVGIETDYWRDILSK